MKTNKVDFLNLEETIKLQEFLSIRSKFRAFPLFKFVLPSVPILAAAYPAYSSLNWNYNLNNNLQKLELPASLPDTMKKIAPVPLVVNVDPQTLETSVSNAVDKQIELWKYIYTAENKNKLKEVKRILNTKKDLFAKLDLDVTKLTYKDLKENKEIDLLRRYENCNHIRHSWFYRQVPYLWNAFNSCMGGKGMEFINSKYYANWTDAEEIVKTIAAITALLAGTFIVFKFGASSLPLLALL